MSKQNKIIIAVIALVVVVAGMAVLAYNFMPKPQAGEKNITVSVVADDKTTDFKVKTSKEFLGEALLEEKIVVGDVGEMGLFITEANGIKAEESKKQWWCITKDGAEVTTGADVTPILDGEKYELTLSTY